MLLARCQSLVTSLLPRSKLGCSGADSRVDLFVYILGLQESLQQTLLGGWEAGFSHHRNPTDFFSQRFWGFLFLCWNPEFCCLFHSPVVLLSLSTRKCETAICYLVHWVYQPLPGHASSLPQLPISAPLPSLDEYLFFNSLVVGLLYSLIFWQSWLFFVFKFVVLLLVIWRGKVYYLCLHLGPSCSHKKISELLNKTLVFDPTTLSCWSVWLVTHLSGNKQRRERLTVSMIWFSNKSLLKQPSGMN